MSCHLPALLDRVKPHVGERLTFLPSVLGLAALDPHVTPTGVYRSEERYHQRGPPRWLFPHQH